jgi:hypothetical protein
MKQLPALAVLLAILGGGCGGGSGSTAGATPAEDPSQAFTRLVHQELSGQRESSYRMLVRAQRAVVPRSLYVSCSPGSPIEDADIVVMRVFDEEFSVPELGRTKTKAVSWRMIVRPPDGSDPITLNRKGHLIAEEGEWRWTLSPKSFASFRAGVCP